MTNGKGYTKAWRKELDSDIWLMPPIYHRVWFVLRQKAQHEEYLFPTPNRLGIWVLPGQRITSYSQIAEWVKWTEYGVEKIPNKKTIKTVLDYLSDREMVRAEGNAKGTLITIINWATYQSSEGAKSNAQVTHNGHKERMNKNVKEVNNLCASKNDARSKGFDLFWDAFAYKRGRADAEKAWKKIKGYDENTLEVILQAAREEAKRRPGIISAGRTPKMAQGWITGRRWEDETEEEREASNGNRFENLRDKHKAA